MQQFPGRDHEKYRVWITISIVNFRILVPNEKNSRSRLKIEITFSRLIRPYSGFHTGKPNSTYHEKKQQKTPQKTIVPQIQWAQAS